MIKNWQSAVVLGLGMWAVMFIGVSAIMVTPLSGFWQKVLEIILSGVAAFILARIYFKKNPGDLKEGLILGVAWFAVGGILDLLVTVQYVKGTGTYLDGLRSFYGMISLWVGFLLMFAGAVLAAKFTHGGQLARPISRPPQQPPASSVPKV